MPIAQRLLPTPCEVTARQPLCADIDGFRSTRQARWITSAMSCDDDPLAACSGGCLTHGGGSAQATVALC